MAAPQIGRTVRRLRQDASLTQQALAVRLGISASYLNLIEHEQRAITASLLIKLAETLHVDLATLSGAQERQLEAGLREVFADVLLDQPVPESEVAALAAGSPAAGRAVLGGPGVGLGQAQGDLRGCGRRWSPTLGPGTDTPRGRGRSGLGRPGARGVGARAGEGRFSGCSPNLGGLRGSAEAACPQALGTTAGRPWTTRGSLCTAWGQACGTSRGTPEPHGSDLRKRDRDGVERN